MYERGPGLVVLIGVILETLMWDKPQLALYCVRAFVTWQPALLSSLCVLLSRGLMISTISIIHVPCSPALLARFAPRFALIFSPQVATC